MTGAYQQEWTRVWRDCETDAPLPEDRMKRALFAGEVTPAEYKATRMVREREQEEAA